MAASTYTVSVFSADDQIISNVISKALFMNEH